MSTHNNYERYQEAKCGLGLADIVNAYDYIRTLIKYVPEDSKLHNYYEEVIKPLKKFVEDCTTDKECPHCGRYLYYSDVEDYEYVCTYCDENFYECEAGDMKIKLGNALYDKCHELQTNGITFIKDYEIAFQEVIEEMFPNKPWWEVTGCEIFLHLFEYGDPEKTVIEILKQLKED